LQMSRFLSNLLGTDEIFAESFDCEDFLSRAAEQSEAWRKKSLAWQLY